MNKKQRNVHIGAIASNINYSTVVFIFDVLFFFNRFHNRALSSSNHGLRERNLKTEKKKKKIAPGMLADP